ncbi:hypothetical protein NFI96_001911 [Prochilodus magdalenae]|nr:hypothetical protein NFI96_001911 [Prochilodus magdalenae]
MIVDPRRRRQELHTPLFIDETEVERVKTFKFLCVHISEDLTWSHNTHYIVRKSQQRLYFLRRLRKFGMSAQILSNFYRSTIERVPTSSITVWYRNCTAQDRKALQRVIKTAQSISGAAFPSLQDIYRTRVIRRAHSIIRDSTHPQHSLFTLLPSGRRYRRSRTVAEFHNLAAGSGWNEPALLTGFHNGLNAGIRKELACRDEGLTLEEYILLAICLDQLKHGAAPVTRHSSAAHVPQPPSSATPWPRGTQAAWIPARVRYQEA